MDPANDPQLLEVIASYLGPLIRFTVGAVTLLVLGLIFRRAILRFLGSRGRDFKRGVRILAFTFLIALILLLIRVFADQFLADVGERVARWLPLRDSLS